MNIYERHKTKFESILGSEKPIITIVPPVEIFTNINIDFRRFLRMFEGIIKEFGNDLDETIKYINSILKDKNVDSVFMFGSAIYRMLTKEEISDLDNFVIFKEFIKNDMIRNAPNKFQIIGETVYEIERHIRSENYGLEERIFASEIVILKESKTLDRTIYEMRKRFTEHWIEIMSNLMCRDVFKEITTKRILSYIKNEKLGEKIKNSNGFYYIEGETEDIPSHQVVNTMKNNNFTQDEMIEIFKATLRRRRVKPKHHDKIIEPVFSDKYVKRILKHSK